MSNEAINQTEVSEQTGIVIDMTEKTNQDKQPVTIGELLREAREAKSLSIDAISRHTKINCTNLEALENNDKDSLPNVAYVKGFVKSYSRIVDIDAEEALSLLDELYNTQPVQTVIEQEEKVELVTEPSVKATKPAGDSIDSGLKLKIFGVIAACAIGAFIFVSRTTKNDLKKADNIVVKPQVLTAETPLTKIESPKPVVLKETKSTEETSETVKAEEKKIEEPVVEKEKKVEVKVEEKIEKKIEKKEEPVVAKKEEVKIEKKAEKKKEDIEFYNFPYPLYTISEITTAKKNELIPSNYQSSIIQGKQNVFITATKGDTWITYKSDADPVKKFILKKGRYILIRGSDVRVFLGNVHVTKVFLNNELLNIKSRSGVKSLVFPQEKAKDLKLPLFIFQKTGKVITSEKYLEDNPID